MIPDTVGSGTAAPAGGGQMTQLRPRNFSDLGLDKAGKGARGRDIRLEKPLTLS